MTLLLLVGLVVNHVLFVDDAQAQSIVYTDSIPMLNVPGTGEILEFPQFDPALGVLTSIEVTVTGEITGVLQYENFDTVDTNDFDLTNEVNLLVGLPDSGIITATGFVTASLSQIPPFDLIYDYAGTSGLTSIQNGTLSDVKVYSSVAVLSQFTGVQSTSLPITTTSSVVTSSPGGPFVFEYEPSGMVMGSIKYNYAIPSISIQKSTNGFDADDARGPQILTGDEVIWEYEVTNTGQVPFVSNEVTVTDSILGSITSLDLSTDDNDDGVLSVGESWTYTATGVATLGQYMNVGNVEATVPGFSGVLTDSDPSHYFGIDPQLDLEKATNGEDADSGTGPLILEGEAVIWTYVITNTGNITIENVQLDDTVLGPITNQVNIDVGADGALAPGEIWIFEAAGIATAGQYENIGSVTGEVPDVSTAPGITETIPVGDDDPSHYFGYTPGIIIEKSTNGEDADTAPGPQIVAGDLVTWTYVVTNTGNITLANVSVTDNVPGVVPSLDPSTDVNNDLLLSPNEAWTFTATGTSQPAQYQNIGAVTADVPDTNETVTDDDPSHYFGGTASIGVDKTVDQSVVDPGTTVTYSYIVSNTGNIPVQNLVVVDDQCSPVEPVLNNGINVGDTNSDGILDLTELWSYTCVVALVVDTINVVTVTGDDPLGNPTDPVTDTETVDVLPTAILTKTAEPTTVPEAGGEVIFTINVENTSQEPLALNSLTDSVFGDLNGVGTCIVPQTLPVGGIYTCAFTRFISGVVGTPHINVASATLTDNEGNPVQPNDDAQVDFDPPGSIELSKTPDKTIIFEPGEDVTFTIVITNTSINDAVTINSISDSVYGDVTIRERTDCSVPQTIALGNTYSCNFTEYIFKNNADGDGDNAVHNNVVTAEGVDEDGNPLNADDNAMVLIDPPPIPNLLLEKTDTLLTDLNGDGTASPGDTIRYDIIIRNTGGGPATGVVLTDTVSIHTVIKPGTVAPSQGVIISGNGAGDRMAVINIGTINSGETVNVSLDVIVDSLASCAISIENQAVLTSNDSDQLLSAPIGTSVPVPTVTLITGTDLEVRQTVTTASVNEQGNAVVHPGEVMNYAVQVENSVALTATNVFLEVKLDGNANLLLNSVQVNGQDAEVVTYRPDTKEFAVGIGSIPPGTTLDVTYDAQLVAPLPPEVDSIMNAIDIVYDFNNVGGQAYEPLIDPDRVDKCLVTGMGEVPTSLVVVNEPQAPVVSQRIPTIFVPIVQ